MAREGPETQTPRNHGSGHGVPHPSIFRQKFTLNNGRTPPPVLFCSIGLPLGSPHSPRTPSGFFSRSLRRPWGSAQNQLLPRRCGSEASRSLSDFSPRSLLFSSGLACPFKCPPFKEPWDLGGPLVQHPSQSGDPAASPCGGLHPPCPPGAAVSPPNHPISPWETHRYFLPTYRLCASQ